MFKYIMKQEIKDEMKALLNEAQKYTSIKDNNSNLDDYIRRISRATNKAIDDEFEFIKLKADEVLAHYRSFKCNNKKELSKKLDYYADDEGNELTDALLEIYKQCNKNIGREPLEGFCRERVAKLRHKYIFPN